jgi:hypothetical protein
MLGSPDGAPPHPRVFATSGGLVTCLVASLCRVDRVVLPKSVDLYLKLVLRGLLHSHETAFRLRTLFEKRKSLMAFFSLSRPLILPVGDVVMAW